MSLSYYNQNFLANICAGLSRTNQSYLTEEELNKKVQPILTEVLQTSVAKDIIFEKPSVKRSRINSKLAQEDSLSQKVLVTNKT